MMIAMLTNAKRELACRQKKLRSDSEAFDVSGRGFC
jgi:hypothetical protein